MQEEVFVVCYLRFSGECAYVASCFNSEDRRLVGGRGSFGRRVEAGMVVGMHSRRSV